MTQAVNISGISLQVKKVEGEVGETAMLKEGAGLVAPMLVDETLREMGVKKEYEQMKASYEAFTDPTKVTAARLAAINGTRETAATLAAKLTEAYTAAGYSSSEVKRLVQKQLKSVIAANLSASDPNYAIKKKSAQRKVMKS